MMNGFEFTEHIEREPERVFRVISDPREATHFLDNIVESVKLTDGPVGAGTSFRETRRMGGKEASAVLVVDAHEPPRHAAISTEAEGIRVVYRYDLTPEGTGTRLTWSCHLAATGLRRMMLPLVTTIMKREDGAHLQRLKAHLEST